MGNHRNEAADARQGNCDSRQPRITYIDRGSPFESRVLFHHRDGGFYSLSVRDVRYYLDLLFPEGTLRSRLLRLYRHARHADCLVTHYA